MGTHALQLATTPFNAIRLGKKTIESRLYDEKRQTIQVGDTIIFTNREAPNESVTVEVSGLLRYKTFHDLFSLNDPEAFGGKSTGQLEEQINEFYSVENQKRYGVLGIKFKLV